MGSDMFDRIADFVLDPDLAVPDEALFRTATLLMDTLGVAVGATRLEAGRIARDFATEFHAAGHDRASARMLFDGRRVSMPGAAWALATQIDNLDGHDGYNPTKGHIGCAVVPSLFALSDSYPELGARVALQALAMAYEVSARAGISLHATVSDYHTSGAWNALGVAALGCRLAGSDRDTLRHALGIAEYHGPRSQMMREIDNPTMLHDGSGMGALVGCSAALLAQRGFTGAPAVTVESADLAPVWADLGQDWTVLRNYIKPYPSCRWGHAALDALHSLMMSEGVSVETATRIEVRTFDEAARLYPGVPETTTQAQYSLPFVLAVILRHGHVGPAHISGDGLGDPEVAALIARIKVVAAQEFNDAFPMHRRSEVTVVLRDGRCVSSGIVDARGGPEAPLSESEIEQKFHAFCEGVLPGPRRDAIWAMRERLLDPQTKLAQLSSLVFDGVTEP